MCAHGVGVMSLLNLFELVTGKLCSQQFLDTANYPSSPAASWLQTNMIRLLNRNTRLAGRFLFDGSGPIPTAGEPRFAILTADDIDADLIWTSRWSPASAVRHCGLERRAAIDADGLARVSDVLDRALAAERT